MTFLTNIILLLAILNVVRLTLLIVASSVYSIKKCLRDSKFKKSKISFAPTISILVPAKNEEKTILRLLESIEKCNYPPRRMQIFVVDDGSTDNTAELVKSYTKYHKLKFRVSIITRTNRGKAEALNYAIKHHVSSELAMCLDADSTVDKDFVHNIVQYFHDKDVVGVASNVNIIENGTLIGLIQRLEYLYSHELKKANTVLNTEYIVGGVGSVFRLSALERVGHYDSNTLTEDIDLTMKIISRGNKSQRVVFASDAITYTEPVQDFKSLVKQRYCWKYGRIQTFYKHRDMFFSIDRQYTKSLTFYMLPQTLFYEALNLLEPFFIIYMILYSIIYADITALATMMLISFMTMSYSLWSSDHIKRKDKFRLAIFSPISYVIFYAIVVVEYCASIKSFISVRTLKQSLQHSGTTWESPARSGKSI